MKSLLAALALVVSTSSAFAAPTQFSEAIELFMADQAVQTEIANVQAQDLKVKTATAVYVSGSCGFAGCDRTYLVSLPVSSGSVNEQSSSIAAIVKIGFLGQTVKLIDLEKLAR